MVGKQSILELLDIYADTIDAQAETIKTLTEILRKQATELHHLKTVYGIVSPSDLDEMTRYYLEP